MPEKSPMKTAETRKVAEHTSSPAPAKEAPSPPPRTIIAEERGQDGSYTIWWSDGSVESGQGGG